jgi:hypothetical protein
MAGDVLYFIHRHFRAFASGVAALGVATLGLTLSHILMS